MSTHRIGIDQSLCSGFGSCVAASPQHFALDDSGVAPEKVAAARRELGRAA